MSFSPDQIKVMQPVLGRSYSSEVSDVLKSKGIKSRKQDYYGASYIVNVFNGVYSNPQIESAILEVYQRRKAEIEKLEWEKDQLTKASL